MGGQDPARPDAVERWLLATYRPTSLFSLRLSLATSKGGKTLFVPTPYAFKLALVDAAFRAEGEGLARRIFETVKGRPVRFRPPEHLAVQNTFIKIKQEERGAPKGTYVPTIAYREFCFYRGDLTVALEVGGLSEAEVADLRRVAAHINYLGKRGSFFQHVRCQEAAGPLEGFTLPDSSAEMRLGAGYGVVQPLDDLKGAGECRFENISSFHPDSVDKFRERVNTFLPYRLEKSAKGYSYYRRHG